MKRRLLQDKDLVGSAEALRRAARQARLLGERTGTPVYVLRNGKIVDLTKEDGAAERRAETTPDSLPEDAKLPDN